jgi:carboxyl-terminal processing protease
MILRKFVLSFLLLITCTLSAKPPQINPKEAKKKVEEILKSHVAHKTFHAEIIKRSLVNFLEELDPSKTYFIENEIVRWENPSSDLLEAIERDYKNDVFHEYEKIYEIMVSAIKRRSEIEKELENVNLTEKVDASAFKDLTWVKSVEELKHRILCVKTLQLEAAENFEDETKAQFFQRITKRRSLREQEIGGGNKEEKQGLILSFVLKAIASSLDSHTSYFTPSEANQFMIQVQQRLFGIGAQLRDNLNGLAIVKLLEGGPALLSNKLKTGDRIIAVNHEPIVGMDITEAVEMIRGPQGSKVHLTILRDTTEEPIKTEKFEIDIIRDEIVLKETRYETHLEPYGDGVIAHIHLFSFYQDPKSSSTQDIKDAIENIKKEHHLLGVVLDLRNNAGGILPQAVSVTGLFIKKGVVVSIKDASGKIQHLRNFEANPVWDGPLLVLTNRASASAAEIVAQALQDYGRALIIGDDRTYGKGSYQSFTLESANGQKINPQGEYKVTRGIYYTVSGKSPQLHGAIADIVVPGLLSEMEIGEALAKYPLEGDHIQNNFDDDLNDVHPLHRGKLKKMYKNQLQPVLSTYSGVKQQLAHNSSKRINLNSNYQQFLKELKKTNPSYEALEAAGQNDLQLEECFNIMKDLIFMSKETSYLEKQEVSKFSFHAKKAA